jgi:hypothetical protein
MKKLLNEGNQILNFISSSGSLTVINYGSGSDLLTIYGSGSTTLPAGGSAPPPFPRRHGAHVPAAGGGEDGVTRFVQCFGSVNISLMHPKPQS